MAGMLSAGTVLAQDPEPGMACCGMMPGMMGAHKGEMMEWHQKMVDKFKAQDAELEKLVAEMNAASGEKKVEAIAAIVNKMMENRKAWHSEMEGRHQKMMEWMKAKMEKMESKGKNMMKSGTATAPK